MKRTLLALPLLVTLPLSAAVVAVDVSSYENITVVFDYNINAFDGGDTVAWEVFVYGSSFTSGSMGGTGLSGEGQIVEPIPDGSSTISLVMTRDQNGATDTFELNNFMVSGDLVPEPSVSLLGALGLIALLRRRRK